MQNQVAFPVRSSKFVGVPARPRPESSEHPVMEVLCCDGRYYSTERRREESEKETAHRVCAVASQCDPQRLSAGAEPDSIRPTMASAVAGDGAFSQDGRGPSSLARSRSILLHSPRGGRVPHEVPDPADRSGAHGEAAAGSACGRHREPVKAAWREHSAADGVDCRDAAPRQTLYRSGTCFRHSAALWPHRLSGLSDISASHSRLAPSSSPRARSTAPR